MLGRTTIFQAELLNSDFPGSLLQNDEQNNACSREEKNERKLQQKVECYEANQSHKAVKNSILSRYVL